MDKADTRLVDEIVTHAKEQMYLTMTRIIDTLPTIEMKNEALGRTLMQLHWAIEDFTMSDPLLKKDMDEFKRLNPHG